MSLPEEKTIGDQGYPVQVHVFVYTHTQLSIGQNYRVVATGGHREHACAEHSVAATEVVLQTQGPMSSCH